MVTIGTGPHPADNEMRPTAFEVLTAGYNFMNLRASWWLEGFQPQASLESAALPPLPSRIMMRP
jgi:hypothetical protein